MNNILINLKVLKYQNNSKSKDYNFYFKKGDVLTVEFYTDNKYKHIFTGICVKKTKNNKVILFNVNEKIYSSFFLYSPNVIKFYKNKI